MKTFAWCVVFVCCMASSTFASEGTIEPSWFENAWDNQEAVWALTFEGELRALEEEIMQFKFDMGFGLWDFESDLKLAAGLRFFAPGDLTAELGPHLSVRWGIEIIELDLSQAWLTGRDHPWETVGILALTAIDTFEGRYAMGAFKLQFIGGVHTDYFDNSYEIGLCYRAKNQVGISISWLVEEGIILRIFLS